MQLSDGYAYVAIEDSEGDAARTLIQRHTLRLIAVYSPPSFDALRLGASARFQSRIKNDYTAQKGYAVVDLMARYQSTINVSLAVNVDNVTNVKYWPSLQWDQAYYAAPRTVRATLRFYF